MRKQNNKKKQQKKKSKRNLRFKQVLSVIVVMAVFFGAMVPLVVQASTTKGTMDVPLLQDGEFNLPTVDVAEDYDDRPLSMSFLSTTSSSTTVVSDFIYNKLKSHAKSFSLLSYKIPLRDFRNLYCNIINDNPDLFFVSSSVNYTYYSASEFIVSVTPEYTMTVDEMAEATEIFNAGVEEALSVVDDSMNDLQKALVIHDYICDNATYPYDAVKNDSPFYHSAYGFFYDKNIVCAGYALAYSHLMHCLGIECEYVASTAMKHAWNVVQIGDRWYNVDLTFDDISFYNSSMNVRGGILHRCFMKSDEAMSSELGYYHYGASTYDDCVADDTFYDDYFWNEVNSNIIVLDGDYYYLDVNTSAKTDVLVKRTADGRENVVGNNRFTFSSVKATVKYKDGDGEYHNVETNDFLCRLVYLDNRFYLTYGKYIVSYALMDNKYKASVIVKDDLYNIIGLGIDEDNNLIYQRISDYQSITLDKTDYFMNNITSEHGEYNNYPDLNLDGVVNAKDYEKICK